MGKNVKDVIEEKSEYVLLHNGVIEAPSNEDIHVSKPKVDEKFLEKMGLAQRVYSDSFFGKKEFPYFDSEKSKFFKLVPEPVTEEEYFQLLSLDKQIQVIKRTNLKVEENDILSNPVSNEPIRLKPIKIESVNEVWRKISSLSDTVLFLSYGLAVVLSIGSVVLALSLESFILFLAGFMVVLLVYLSGYIASILIKGYAQIVRNNEEQINDREQ